MKSQNFGLYIALGAGVGVAMGAAFGNPAIGVALGAGVGVAIGSGMMAQAKKKAEEEEKKDDETPSES